MAFSYDKLWKLLIDKKMTKESFRLLIKASPTTIAAMGKGDGISPKILDRICTAFKCQPGDIMEHTLSDKNVPDSPVARQPDHEPATKLTNKEKHYRAFTEADASRVDLQELTTNIKYQFDIGETFGMNVLADLLQKARQQQEEKATTQPINDTL